MEIQWEKAQEWSDWVPGDAAILSATEDIVAAPELKYKGPCCSAVFIPPSIHAV